MSEIWQYPFVDVFKSFNLWDWKNSKKAGEVVEELDSTIGRKIISITGTVPSNNYVTLPKSQAEMKTLALKGRYLYLCVCGIASKPYALHIDYSFPDAKNVRLSISNMYKEVSFDQLTVHVPMRLPEKKWSIICLDVKSYFAKFGCIKDVKASHVLKAITICANIKVSKIVTSDKVFYYDSFPKELNFKSVQMDKWLERYEWIEPIPCERPKLEEDEKEVKEEAPKEKKRATPKKPAKKEAVPDKTAKEQLEEEAKYTQIRAKSEETKAKLLQKVMGKENLMKGETVAATITKGDSAKTTVTKQVRMPKDTLLQLKGIIGATINSCPSVCWSHSIDNKEIIYAAGSVIVMMETGTEKQRLLKGHTGPIKKLCISPKGDLIGSTEKDKIRIWSVETGRCVATWSAEKHLDIKCISISPDSGFLATAGIDTQNRDILTIWDLKTASDINVAKPEPDKITQISPYDINFLKFCPEMLGTSDSVEMQLCSCGKENVRFWRVKDKNLRATAVVLNKYSRGTMFTCLDYEGKGKVYVGSKEGMILQVNAEVQELEFVYQLHEPGIRSLAVCEAFCVTGSDDMFLRVWPLDFSEFFMEAKHESQIQTVSISPDCIEILCATENGCVGSLDIPNQKYKTLVRSHTQPILAIDMFKNNLISLSQDKTIRLWDTQTIQQLYEFASYEDQAISVAFHPVKSLFTCGFVSGNMRVFDIEKTSLAEDYKVFDKPLVVIKYLPKSNVLIAMSEEGSLSFFQSHTHQLMKQVNIDIPTPYYGFSALSSEKLFVTIGSNATSILIWDTSSLTKTVSIPVSGCQIRDIAMRSNTMQILALTSDAQLRVFSLDGKMQGRFILSDIDVSPLVPNARISIAGNGKYITLYKSDSIIRQIILPNISVDQSSSMSQAEQQLEIDEYTGHISPVQSALYNPHDPSMFVSVGGTEGIFIWAFQGDISETVEEKIPESFSSTLKKSAMFEPKKLDYKTLSMKVTAKAEEIKEEKKEEKKEIHEIEVGSSQIRVSSSLAISLMIEEEKQSIDSKKQLLNKEALAIMKKKEIHLPSKHFMEISKEPVSKKAFADAEGVLEPEIVIGYNGHAHDNLIWNEKAGWIAYSVRNKLILEDVASRVQEIYMDQEADISTLAISADKRMFACAAGVAGATSKTADIFVYQIAEAQPKLKLHKKLSLYQVGVQSIEFVGGPKYLCSVGRYPELTMALWDVELGICVAAEKLKTPVNDIKMIESEGENEQCDWITVSRNEVIEWKLKSIAKKQLEAVTTIYRVKNTNKDFVFTCIAQTAFIPSEESYVYLIGTTEGSVVLYNPIKGEFVGEYPVFEGQISNIAVTSKSIVIGGTSDTVLRWQLPEVATTHPNFFVSKPSSITLDSHVVAMWFDADGNEGQIGTDLGTIWYVNWNENATVKLQSGHLSAQVRGLSASKSPAVFVSAASDDTLKVWSQKSCDQVMEFEVPSVECSAIGVNDKICAAAFMDGNIRFFSLATLKNLGKAKITSNPISSLAIAVSGTTIFVGDISGDLFLVSIDSLEPLAVKTQKLLTMEGGITGLDVQRIMPANKFVGASGHEMFKVWEKTEKKNEIQSDPFSLAKDWQFVEIDSFSLAPGDNKQISKVQDSQVSLSKALAVFSSTNASLCICCTSTAQALLIRNLEKRQFAKKIALTQLPLCLSLLPDKNRIAVGGSEGVLELLDTETGRANQARANSGRIEAIFCTQSNSNIITGSYGELIKWNITMK